MRERAGVRVVFQETDMPTAKKNAFYAQSGGVTAVINASACGVIETARANKDRDRKSTRLNSSH